MKLKAILLLLFFSLIITSCGKQKSELYIITTTVHGMDKQEVRKDTLTMIDSDYFEVSLQPMMNGAIYKAGKDLVKPSIGREFQMVFFEVVDKEGKKLRFKDTTEFLNFMASKGYTMVDQTKGKYNTDYTFRKR